MPSYSFARVFFLVFVYFLIWAVIKPPFQAPDEFQHSFKAFSVTREPWLAQENPLETHQRFVNPLAHDPLLAHIPFRADVQLAEHDIFMLKTQAWGNTTDWAVGKVPSSAFNYPPLYYLSIFTLGQGTAELFSLTPYQSIYIYRLASALMAAMLWSWVYLLLKKMTLHYNAVFLVVLLNPMLAFMSSSINPDAMLYPLSALTILFSFRLFFERNSSTLGALGSISACALTKSAALVMYPVLAVLAGLLFFLRQRDFLLRAVGVVALSIFLVYALFYAWATPTTQALAAQGLKGLDLSIWEYLKQRTLLFLWESYWGNLGWLDYRLPAGYYSVLNWVLAANLIWVLWCWRKWLQHPFSWYALTFAVIYSAGTFAVEYRFLPVASWVLQGRYFLPVSLGFAMLLVAHEGRLAKWSLILYLVVFNVAFMGQTVTRYYDGDWVRLWHALPFTSAIDGPASVQREIQVMPYTGLHPENRQVRQGFVDDIRVQGSKIFIRGWAPLRGLVVGQTITVRTRHTPLSQHLEVVQRPDVVEAFKNVAYTKSGFSVTLIYPDGSAAQQAYSDLLCVTATDEHGTVFLLESKNKKCVDLADEKNGAETAAPSALPARRAEVGYHGHLSAESAGHIDTVETEDGQLKITGWFPWRIQDGSQTLHVLADTALGDVQIVGITRPDVARHLGSDDYLPSGFKISSKLANSYKSDTPPTACIVAREENGSGVPLQNLKSPDACAILADKIHNTKKP